MAYALVGTIGAASQSVVNTAITPAWGTSENRDKGNLLILWTSVTGSATSPSLSANGSGWQSIPTSGTSCAATIWYKVATGGETAPTVAAIPSGRVAVQLAEFSGNELVTPTDKNGANQGTTSPLTATMGAASVATSNLIVACGADFRSVARASNDTWTSNHATFTLAGSNNGVSSVNHYSNAYATSLSSVSGADTAIMTLSITTSITGLCVEAATFKVPSVGFTPYVTSRPQLLAQ